LREFPFVCTGCEYSAPSANELAEHLTATHEPIPVEDFTEFVRRGMTASAALEEATRSLVQFPIDELADTEGSGARLERLRLAAAAAIAEQRRPRLFEVEAELRALGAAAESERDRHDRIARVALESADVAARVLEVLPQDWR